MKLVGTTRSLLKSCSISCSSEYSGVKDTLQQKNTHTLSLFLTNTHTHIYLELVDGCGGNHSDCEYTIYCSVLRNIANHSVS